MSLNKLTLNSSVLAGIAAAGFIAAASVSGAVTAQDAPAVKGDRFAVVGEELCGDQAWPNITAECVAWRNNAPRNGETVRYVTIEKTDAAARFTELERRAIAAE